jgi:hypothetical protein
MPLAVPKPDVETKDTKKMTGSANVDPGLYSGVEAGLPEEIIVIKSKSRNKYDWDSESRLTDPLLGMDTLLGKEEDQRDDDDWLNGRPESGRATNGSNLKMPRGWDARASDGSNRRTNDSNLHGRQNTWIFGSKIGLDAETSRSGNRDGQDDKRDGLNGDRERKDDDRVGLNDDRDGRDDDRDAKAGAYDGRYGTHDGRSGTQITWDGDLKGQDASKEKNGLFSSVKFGRDSSGTDRFNAARFTPFMGESGDFAGSAHEPQMIMPGQAPASAHMTDLPSAFPRDDWNYTPFGDSQSSQSSEPFGGLAGESQGLRAWDQPPSSQSPTRSNFSPGQNSPTRMEAPSRPVILPFPKRPGDPF